ncbi:hypothetical protein TGAMA5MH_03402 [Trichoderma gamsii]|uniref:FAD-binding PCMH-type domain-containing protein n=1 Tax=Trichoderma gamsii TaxID=398673 RepID=A0A2K0THJ2_9HYPO|nr:hypothetical protein TGAMA5MH_03402 [Trichoderma gamsii]
MRHPITAQQVKELAAQLDSSTRLLTAADGDDYEKSISRWADNAVKRAGAVAVPVSYEEVSKLVKFASANELELAVRGGGHSTGGTSSTEGGLTIDLSRMRAVKVDKDSKLIVAQGGALWEDVDNAAIEKGLATVGGTVNHTGIGGLTLGGGMGWLTGLYGTVVDNLVEAKIVVADGRILSVSENENADLFWAIRGAGHNFGVAVEFTFRGYDQTNEIYAGGLVFTPDKLTSLVEGFNTRMKTSEPQAAGMLLFAKPPGMPVAVVVVNVFYNGDEAAAKEYFKFLFDLQPVAITAKMMPYNHLNALLNPLATHGRRKALKAVTVTNHIDVAFVQELYNDYSQQLEKNPDMSASFLGIEIHDVSKIQSVPLESMAFANRGPYRPGIVGLEWTDPTMDEENRAWGRMIQAKCRQAIIASKEFSGDTKTSLEYANYVEPGDLITDRPFGGNQQRLAILKQKYDPDVLFYKTNPITPLRTEAN